MRCFNATIFNACRCDNYLFKECNIEFTCVKSCPTTFCDYDDIPLFQVIDHYENPRNVGSMNKKDFNVGTGLVGAPACGDVMKLQVIGKGDLSL